MTPGALVTGGGTGIGAAVALRLAADGFAVTICGRTESKLVETAERIRSAHPDAEVRTVVADVTVEGDVERLVAAAAEHSGRLDAVVANAGGGGGLGPYHLQDTAEFIRVLQLNVVGTMLLVKHTLPHLIATGGGSFVGMSSIAAGTTHPYFGAYPVAKGAIDQLMRNAADEYGYASVRFNAVRPGFIATEIMQAIPKDSPTYGSYVDNTVIPRLGEPADVAALCSFLLGPDSTWITGQVINVDGGHSLRRGPDYGPFLEPVLGGEAMRPTAGP